MCDGSQTHMKQRQLNQTVKREEKKQKSVEKAIPNIADAIKTVVSLSKNEDFKRKCFNLIKVKDEEQFSEALEKKMWKMVACGPNVKTSKEEKSQQIVPDTQLLADETKKPATVESTTRKNAVYGEDDFDDLAGEISFYNYQNSEENCPPTTTDHEDHKTTDTLDSGSGSYFELLAELHWDFIPEEGPQSSLQVQDSQTHHTAELGASVSEATSQQSSALPTQERQQSVDQERDKSSPPSEKIPDFTSPKAKQRCRESAMAPPRENISSNDWLEEFSQDGFWVGDKNISEKHESEPSLLIQKDMVEVYTEVLNSKVNSSQQVSSTDDFDALAELSAI